MLMFAGLAWVIQPRVTDDQQNPSPLSLEDFSVVSQKHRTSVSLKVITSIRAPECLLTIKDPDIRILTENILRNAVIDIAGFFALQPAGVSFAGFDHVHRVD